MFQIWKYLEETLSDRVYKVYDSEVEPCFNSSEGWGSSEQRVDVGVWWKDMGGDGERKGVLLYHHHHCKVRAIW